MINNTSQQHSIPLTQKGLEGDHEISFKLSEKLHIFQIKKISKLSTSFFSSNIISLLFILNPCFIIFHKNKLLISSLSVHVMKDLLKKIYHTLAEIRTCVFEKRNRSNNVCVFQNISEPVLLCSHVLGCASQYIK